MSILATSQKIALTGRESFSVDGAMQNLTKRNSEYAAAAAMAIKQTLGALGANCATPGTYLNTLITIGLPMPDLVE
jgi:hypothetical protein